VRAETVHPLKELVAAQKRGVCKGIWSVCSANEYVIEAAMDRANDKDEYLLIESTANQVNQYGGYTGMVPDDFRAFVSEIARKADFPLGRLILGGDHLGPLTWQDETSDTAMEKAVELIRQYVLAGFTKIHIDTSMRLADDSRDCRLSTETMAERGAILCKAAEQAFAELKESHPCSLEPVYVVGSEVPTPGGSQEQEEGLRVTRVADFEETVEVFASTFKRYGLGKAWENVIAVVVQPGVEFGDEGIHDYERQAAGKLRNAIKKYPNLVFEGHSTDYQTAAALKQMVEDGIAILKVGPALTFALREGLFALNYIENELFRYDPDIQLSNFIDVLDYVMAKSPANWQKHYHGTAREIRLARKFSLSDRCRYYLPVNEVRESMELMIRNLRSTQIPLTLISQFMPVQYRKIRNGTLSCDPEALLKDRVVDCIDDYIYATTPD